jgi:hypothetical protein
MKGSKKSDPTRVKNPGLVSIIGKGEMEMEMETQEMKVRDLVTAAFLICRGHRITRTTGTGSTVFFHFPASPGLQHDIEALRFGDDLASARSLFSARSYLLRLIHDDGGCGA